MKCGANFIKKGKRSIAYSLITGVCAALIISVLLLSVATSLVVGGTVSEARYKVFVFAIRAISVLLGSVIGTILAKEKYLIVISIIATVYIVILASLGIVFYNGSFDDFGMGMISVLLGAALGLAISLNKQLKPKSHKFRNR